MTFKITERAFRNRFSRLEKKLGILDSELEVSASRFGMRYERNMYGEPGRTLHKDGNPGYSVDISLEVPWREMKPLGRLVWGISVGASYESPTEPEIIFNVRSTLCDHQPLSSIKVNLQLYLRDAQRLIVEWTPEMIMRTGRRIRKVPGPRKG